MRINFILLLTLLFLANTKVLKIQQNKDTNEQFVTIIGTNDIHGWAFPIKLKRADNNQTFNYGGLSVMSSIIKIIKKQNPGNTLYLDAGDQAQGALQSSALVSKGRIMNKFYDSLNLDASSIGNHQFNFGYKYVVEYLQDRISPNLAANIRSKQEKEFLPNQKSSKLFELQNGLKIGVIGLSTIRTPAQSPGFGPPFNINNITFVNYTQVVIDESKELKSQGANAVIILGHVGDNCFHDEKYGIWTNQTIQQACKPEQMTQLINSLPQNTIDAVVQGHAHTICHNYIKNIPIIGSTGPNYLNVIQMKFKNGKLKKTWIQGPIPVCQKVFKNTNLCNYNPNVNDSLAAGPLVDWYLNKQLVKPDQKFDQWLKNVYQPKLAPYSQVLCENQIYLQRSTNKQTQMANLLSNLIKAQFPSSNIGIGISVAIRSELYPGPIRYIDLYNLISIDLPIKSYSMPAGQALRLLSILQSAPEAFYFAYGIQQTLFISKDGNKRGLVSAKWQNGTDIDPQSTVQLIIPELTINSVQNQLTGKKQPILTIFKESQSYSWRDTLQKQLRKLGTIKKDTLIDPLHPRMIVNIV